MAAEARAGTPPAQPATQPAAASITSLGEPSQDIAELRAEIAELRRERQERAPLEGSPIPPQPQRPALPVSPADPDILGIPGLKPLRLTTDDDDKPVTRHPLFYIDGEAVTVPDEVSSTVTVNYLRIIGADVENDIGRGQALVAGQSYLLREMLGDDGYKRLCDYKPLTQPQLTWIIETCTRIALGTIEIPKA